MNYSKEKNEVVLLPQIEEIKGRNITKNKENQIQILIDNQGKKEKVSTFITGTDIINENKELENIIKLKSESQKILKTSNDNNKENLGKYYFPIIMRNMRREYSSLANLLKNKPIDLSKKVNFYKNKGLFKGPVNLGRENNKRILFSPIKINNDKRYYQKKYFYDKFINSQENQLNARQIAMNKLPQIK